MGEHSAPVPAWRTRLLSAVTFILAHKGKILTVAIAVLPALSRYVPGFPSDEVLAVVRALLGT